MQLNEQIGPSTSIIFFFFFSCPAAKCNYGYEVPSIILHRFFPASLYTARSFMWQGNSSRGHIGRRSMVCWSVPHSQLVSPVKYPHLALLTLQLPLHDLRRLRHHHPLHAASAPDGKLSPTGSSMETLRGRPCILSCHSILRSVLAMVESAGSTCWRKAFLDISLHSAGWWLKRGCL